MGGRAWCAGLIGAFVLLAGCEPKYPLAPGDKAVLVGMREFRTAHSGRSYLRGAILSLDGRSRNLTEQERVEPGCHSLEAEVEYLTFRQEERPEYEPACTVVEGCISQAKYESGLRHFAISMRPGFRYELSARIDEQAVTVYFVEVDPEFGTVARFSPVDPGSDCLPGTAL